MIPGRIKAFVEGKRKRNGQIRQQVGGQVLTFDIAKRSIRLLLRGNRVCLRNSARPSWQTLRSLLSRRRAAS